MMRIMKITTTTIFIITVTIIITPIIIALIISIITVDKCLCAHICLLLCGLWNRTQWQAKKAKKNKRKKTRNKLRKLNELYRCIMLIRTCQSAGRAPTARLLSEGIALLPLTRTVVLLHPQGFVLLQLAATVVLCDSCGYSCHWCLHHAHLQYLLLAPLRSSCLPLPLST